MGGNAAGNDRGRWLALAAVLVVSAGMLYAQATESPRRVEVPAAAAPAGTPAVTTAAAPADTGAAPVGAPQIASPAEVKLLAESVPVGAQQFQFALPAGIAPEQGLQVKTIWAARAIAVLFPEVSAIYGFRQDPLKWHPNGLAIDVAIPSHNTDAGIELGNQIAGYAMANAKRWGVLHVIWRQKIYPGIGAPSWTADYGSETLNHYDHVHIATDGGGYPTGQETYYIGSMSPPPQG